VVDVSTHDSVVRYTGNWKGSMEGWLLTPDVGFRSAAANPAGPAPLHDGGPVGVAGRRSALGRHDGALRHSGLCKQDGVPFLAGAPQEASAPTPA
jgi:hypothetical protein